MYSTQFPSPQRQWIGQPIAPTPGGRQYKYDKLMAPENGIPEIRLLEILPDAYANPAPAFPWQMQNHSAPANITIQLVHVRLGQAPPYSALSYCWGPEDNKPQVICNGGTIAVTRNLHSALLTLRNRQLVTADQPRYYWIDAICINQDEENAEEKSQQLRLMTQIYQQAFNVLVWLGEAEPYCDMAFAVIPLLAAASAFCGGLSAHTMTALHWAQLGFAMPDPQKIAHFRAFYRLLKRPWFKRAWIIQEYGVAKSVRMICGRHEVDDLQLIAASVFLASTETDVLLNCPWKDNVMFLLHSTKAEQQVGTKLPLLVLLQRYHMFYAGQARDKIFSLIGLAADTGPEAGHLNIEVDCNVDPAVLYQDVAVQTLRRDMNLDVLSYAGTHRIYLESLMEGEVLEEKYKNRLVGLPSWVPDWHQPDATASIQLNELAASGADTFGSPMQFLQKPAVQYAVNFTPTKFRASGDRAYRPSFTADGKGLLVRAMFLDSIGLGGGIVLPKFEVPVVWWKDVPYDEGIHYMFLELDMFANWCDVVGVDSAQPYFTGESMLDVLWQTMLGGHYMRGPDMERQIFMDWWTATKTARGLARQLKSRPWLRHAAVQAYQVYKASKGGFGLSASFLTRTKVASGNKFIFRTAGHPQFPGYVGLAPNGGQVGDWIVILEGGSTPFLVRPSGGSWELIGACYVHGCMMGSSFDPSKCVQMTII